MLSAAVVVIYCSCHYYNVTLSLRGKMNFDYIVQRVWDIHHCIFCMPDWRTVLPHKLNCTPLLLKNERIEEKSVRKAKERVREGKKEMWKYERNWQLNLFELSLTEKNTTENNNNDSEQVCERRIINATATPETNRWVPYHYVRFKRKYIQWKKSCAMIKTTLAHSHTHTQTRANQKCEGNP